MLAITSQAAGALQALHTQVHIYATDGACMASWAGVAGRGSRPLLGLPCSFQWSGSSTHLAALVDGLLVVLVLTAGTLQRALCIQLESMPAARGALLEAHICWLPQASGKLAVHLLPKAGIETVRCPDSHPVFKYCPLSGHQHWESLPFCSPPAWSALGCAAGFVSVNGGWLNPRKELCIWHPSDGSMDPVDPVTLIRTGLHAQDTSSWPRPVFPASNVSFSPDGTLLAAALSCSPMTWSGKGVLTVHIIHWRTGQLLSRAGLELGLRSVPRNAASFSSDALLVWAASGGAVYAAWRLCIGHNGTTRPVHGVGLTMALERSQE